MSQSNIDMDPNVNLVIKFAVIKKDKKKENEGINK